MVNNQKSLCLHVLLCFFFFFTFSYTNVRQTSACKHNIRTHIHMYVCTLLTYVGKYENISIYDLTFSTAIAKEAS